MYLRESGLEGAAFVLGSYPYLAWKCVKNSLTRKDMWTSVAPNVLFQKLEEKQREESKIFRKKMEDKIGVFLGQDVADGRCLTFPPMTKYERSVVHDVAEVTGATVAHRYTVCSQLRTPFNTAGFSIGKFYWGLSMTLEMTLEMAPKWVLNELQ